MESHKQGPQLKKASLEQPSNELSLEPIEPPLEPVSSPVPEDVPMLAPVAPVDEPLEENNPPLSTANSLTIPLLLVASFLFLSQIA
jgi:hypothetical protein